MAFLAQPDLPGGEQFGGVNEYPGFHTTENFDVAATYAVMRVGESFTVEAEDGTHYVTDYPVVVALDMAGHLPQTDYDAEKVVRQTLEDQLQWVIQDRDLTMDSTDEEILEAAEYIAMGGQEYESGGIEDWVQQLWTQTQYTMRNPLDALVNSDPEGTVEGIRWFLQTGQLSDEMLMRGTDQYRYEEDISELRLRTVWYIQPMATEMSDYQSEDSPYFEGVPHEQMDLQWPGFHVTDVDDYMGSYLSFNSEKVWEETEPRFEGDDAAQLPLFSQEQLPRESVIQYHGTTLSRLLQASPGLAGQLPAPPSPPYQGEMAMAASKRAQATEDAEPFEVEMVPTSELVPTEPLDEKDPGAVQDILYDMQEERDWPTDLPPISVTFENGDFIILNGHHRWLAAQEAPLDMTLARIFPDYETYEKWYLETEQE